MEGANVKRIAEIFNVRAFPLSLPALAAYVASSDQVKRIYKSRLHT